MYKKTITILTIAALCAVSTSFADEASVNKPVEETEMISVSEAAELTTEHEQIEEVTFAEDEEIEEVVISSPPAQPLSFGKDGATFEFEDVFTWAEQYKKADSNASGGYLIKSGGIDTSITVPTYGEDVTFTVTDAGVYSVHFLCNMVCENLTFVKFSIDDTVIADNSNGTSKPHTSTKLEAINQQIGSKNIEDFYAEMNLTEGEHTMHLIMTREYNCHAAAFDSIYFYQPKQYTQMNVNCPNMATSGDEIPISITDQDLIAVDSRNYSSLEVTTDTPSIININAGKVYARNPGKGKIKVVMKTNEQEFVKEIELNVAASNGLIIKSVVKDGTKVKATLYATENFSEAHKLTLSSFNKIRGIKTSFVKYETQSIPAMSTGEEKTVEFDIEDWDKFDELSLYMHSGTLTQYFNIITTYTDIK